MCFLCSSLKNFIFPEKNLETIEYFFVKTTAMFDHLKTMFVWYLATPICPRIAYAYHELCIAIIDAVANDNELPRVKPNGAYDRIYQLAEQGFHALGSYFSTTSCDLDLPTALFLGEIANHINAKMLTLTPSPPSRMHRSYSTYDLHKSWGTKTTPTDKGFIVFTDTGLMSQ